MSAHPTTEVDSDPENPDPNHRRSLRGSVSLHPWRGLRLEFGWRKASKPPVYPVTAAAAAAAAPAEHDVPEHVEYIWDNDLGKEVKVSRPAAGASAAAAPPAAATPVNGEDGGKIFATGFCFKTDGEYAGATASYRDLSAYASLHPNDPAFQFQEAMLLQQMPANAAAIFIVVSRVKEKTGMGLDRITCRINNGTNTEVAWLSKRDADVYGASAYVVGAVVADVGTPSHFNFERLGLPLTGVNMSNTVDSLQEILYTRYAGLLSGAAPRVADTSKGLVPVTMVNKPFTVGLSWDYEESDMHADLDLSCVITHGEEVYDVIAYNHRQSVDKAILHSGDATFGTSYHRFGAGCGDDEQITVDLPKVKRAAGGVMLWFCVNVCTIINSAGPAGHRARLILRHSDSPTPLYVLDMTNIDLRWRRMGCVMFAVRSDRESWGVYEMLSHYNGEDWSGSLDFIAERARLWNKEPGMPLPDELEHEIWRRSMDPSIICYAPVGSVPAGRPADYQCDDRCEKELLGVRIIRGFGLLAVDKHGEKEAWTSDPFVEYGLLDLERSKPTNDEDKTEVVKRDLNPWWHEMGWFFGPYEEETFVVYFQVKDKEFIGSRDIGYVSVKLPQTYVRGPQMLRLGGEAPKGKTPTGFLVVSFQWNEPLGGDADLWKYRSKADVYMSIPGDVSDEEGEDEEEDPSSN